MGKQEELIVRRHSTRNFDSTCTISRADQERILRAGLRAPSPKNRQPWQLVVLDCTTDIQAVADMLRAAAIELQSRCAAEDIADLDMVLASAEIIRSAAALVLVCYERDERNQRGGKMDWPLSAQGFEAADLQSIGACVENMLLTAEELGVASLWLCDVLYAEDRLRAAFALEYPLVATVAFGKAAVAHTPRKSLAEKVRWLKG